MKSLIKFLVSLFKARYVSNIRFLSKKDKFKQVQSIIHFFYILIFLFETHKFSNWNYWINQKNFDPLWPIYWLKYVPVESGIILILSMGLLSSLLSITFCNWRITRIIVFLSLLEFIAFQNSFGKINHHEHLLILLSFILIFLPSGWHSLKNVNRYIQTATLMVFSSCQLFIMLTYTMAGIGKITGTLQQIFQGQIHNLAPKALALHTASQFLRQGSQTALGVWLIEHYYIGWPLMLGIIYLQLFALYSVFRPSLHQIWGFSLIIFHISSLFIMNINFTTNCLLLILFFLNSPFRPLYFCWKQILKDLPIIGFFFIAIQPD